MDGAVLLVVMADLLLMQHFMDQRCFLSMHELRPLRGKARQWQANYQQDAKESSHSHSKGGEGDYSSQYVLSGSWLQFAVSVRGAILATCCADAFAAEANDPQAFGLAYVLGGPVSNGDHGGAE